MISELYAKGQIKRLAGLDFFPGEPAAVKELVTALSHAKSEAIARNTIDSFMAEMTTCPKPAEVRRVLFDLGTDKEWEPSEQESSTRCGRCLGTGWVHEKRRVGVEWNDYAGKCACGARVR